MKVLITGGAGFLGLHLSKYLAQKKAKLYLLDIAPHPRHQYPEVAQFIKGDVRDKKVVEDAVGKVDFVVHAAAALPLWRREKIFSINVDGTKNVLEFSLKHNVKRVIFVSSTAVYGVPEKHPIEEDDPLVGVGPYGESKIEAEAICQDFRKKGLVVPIIRPKTFVGTHRLGVFEILFNWVKDGKRVPVIGSGENRYQLLDVEDLIEVIYLCLTVKDGQKVNNIFNVGAEKFGTVKEDLEKLFEYAERHLRGGVAPAAHLAGVKSTILPTPAFPVKKLLWFFEKLKLSPLYQWVYDTADKDSYVSIDRLIKTLSWHPKYSNADALIKAYQWYLDNYKEIKSKPPGITHTVGWDQGILGLIKKFL